ncbi:Serine/threonine-protein kinase smg1 [Coemansia sp. IMI 203386]|nr:Serine/threonine-protein kinase smg1 [Coemansia sp. IMI 203386]
MSIASRVVSAGSVSDIGGLAEFWLAELQWVVDSWVDSGNRVVDVDNTSSLLVLSKIESVYLLCHLIDLALGIGAVDYSSLVKCLWECVNILNRDKQRVAIGAYLPLVNLAGIVCARNKLDKDSAELALDIARNVVKQMKYLQPASAVESALALMFCLAKKTPRLEIESCVSGMLDVAVSLLGFRHKLLKISVGRFILALLAENPRIYNGLVDATYTLLGDDSSEVRNAWSQVACTLNNMSLLSSGYISGAVETTPITAYLRNTRLFRTSNAFGERDVDECACALSVEDALAIISGVVVSCKYSAADLVADTGLSQPAIQCIYSIYRATASANTAANTNSPTCKTPWFSVLGGVHEKVMLMVASSSRRICAAEPKECLSTASYLLDSVKQCKDRSIGAMFWILELIFHLCQPGRPAHLLLADGDTKILLLAAASECSNMGFSGFISSLVAQQLQSNPETSSSNKQYMVESIGQRASDAFSRILDCEMGDAFGTVVSWCVSEADQELLNKELYSLRLFDNITEENSASSRLSRFDQVSETNPSVGLQRLVLDVENTNVYIDSHKQNLFLADRFLDRAVCRATTSLAAVASDILQLSVEKTYSLASVPTASERNRLAAVRQAFIRGDACPSRVLELLRNWVHVEHLDNYGVREWWETYTCSAISAAFNSRLVGLESSADAAHQWISLELVGAPVEKVSLCDRLDTIFARKPCVDMSSAIFEANVFMQTHCSGNCDINIAAAEDDGVYTTKAKEALLYLGSDDKVSDVTTNKLFTDLLMNGTGKIRSTAAGMFDPASLLISRMATSPTQTPVLLSDTLNHNAQAQLAPFIPQLFAMLCYNHSSSRGSDTSKINGALVNDSALRILQLLAQSAPELLVFYTVVTSKSLPKTSRGGQLVSQLLGLFDSATVADIHLFLSLAGSVAVLPQEQLRRACIKAKTAHHRAVTTLVQSTGVDLQAAVDEALGPVYRIISEYSDKEMAQSPIEAEFIAKVPRLKMLVDQLSCSSIDMADISNCLRGFEAVWTEIFKTASTASSLAVGQISPRLLGFRAPIPIPSLTNPTEPLYFAQIGSAVRVIGSKTRPKLISLHLANRFGEISRHKYILKGSEDLRIDECVMQTFVRLNRVLGNGNGDGEQGRSGRLAVYNVVPIDTYGGLLQVVDNAPSLFHLYSKQAALIQGMGSPRLSNSNNQQTLQQPAVVPTGFHQVYMTHAQQVLCQSGLPSTLPMDKWPPHVFVAVYESLTTDGGSVNSSSLLYNHLLRAAQSSSHLLLTMQNMVRSIGIASIAGYIVGLGDRHLDNLLVDANVGQLVHVDFNVCFDFGSVSQIPEQVPFRMSPALSYLCGTAPIPGSNRHMELSEQGAFSFSRVFESAARTVLKLARMDRQCLVDAITSRSLFRPFMEWCWMEETRLREQRKRGNKQQRGAVLSPIISPASGSFAFAQPENSNNADTGAGAAVQNTGSAGSSSLLLLRPPPSLSEKVVDRVWNQNCETMRTDEFVRATGLCPPNGFWPRRRFAVSARSEETQMDNKMVVNSITEIPYGWRIAYEARDRVDARLAYNGGSGERDDDELVSEQIRVLWQAATCKDRLSRMFMGWAPWV